MVSLIGFARSDVLSAALMMDETNWVERLRGDLNLAVRESVAELAAARKLR